MNGRAMRQEETKLKFVVGHVRRLIAHSRRCPTRLEMGGVLATSTGAGLVLVLDEQIYLASSGADSSPLESGERLAFVAEEQDQPEQSAHAWLDDLKDTAVFIKAEDLDLVMGNADDDDMLTIAVSGDRERLTKVLLIPPAACGVDPN